MAHATHGQHDSSHAGGSHHGPSYYVKIWGILLVLLIISLLGPMIGHKVVTIITAFGIAIVKALIVAAFFMHLNVEKRYVWYLLLTMLLAVLLFFFGTAADVMKFDGQNWTKPASYVYAEDFKKLFGGEHGHHDEGAEPGEGGEHGEAAPAADAAHHPG